MRSLEVSIATNDALDVRQFSVREGMSQIFNISLQVLSRNEAIDFDRVIGQAARFTLNAAADPATQVLGGEPRVWTGVCSEMHEIESEQTGYSTYQLVIVHRLWLLTQRTNYRIFQQKSEPEIVLEMLREWQIEPVVRLNVADYKKRKYKVQHAETDFAFISRMLEEAGIAYTFQTIDGETKMVLTDRPQTNEPRREPLRFVENVDVNVAHTALATSVAVNQQVRAGRVTLRDHDYRLHPSYFLAASAAGGLESEQRFERFQYVPGAFLFGAEGAGDTPTADDRGRTRTDEREGSSLAQRRFDADRAEAKRVSFATNLIDLAPGTVLTIVDHPRADLGPDHPLLVLSTSFDGFHMGAWSVHAEAGSAEIAHRPALRTPRPTIAGIQSATVVGPEGEEIHVDEFGRVRVQFHWDREGEFDERASCWVPVSQPWAGAGYGATMLPRVGQEVLVDFLGGDPDRPVVTGRVYTAVQTTPYALPANKTQSGWRSNSSPSNGGYNEIMMEDKAGSELLRIRAQKDQQINVLHDRTTSVGHDCSTSVGNNSNLQVGVNLGVTVGANASVGVGRNYSTTVTAACSTSSGGPMSLSTSSGMSLSGGPTINATARDIMVTANQTMTLTAGNGASQIILCAAGIIINGPKVWVNPGAEQIQNILRNGEPTTEDPPPEPDVVQQLIDMASNAVSQAWNFAQQHPEIVIAGLAPLAAPLAIPLVPLAIPIAAGYAVSQAMNSSPTPASPSFGGGGAGGGW
ncbi:MAG: type VI secretion system tip protein TssI/VgrG [Polyangiaceae bacterium]